MFRHEVTDPAAAVLRLRRQVRGLGVLLLGCATVVLVGMRSGPQESVTAKEFVLLDSYGRKRATLRMERGGPALALYDNGGRVRGRFAIDEYGWGEVRLFDGAGRNRGMFFVNDSSSNLFLFDWTGRGGVVSSVDPTGSDITLYDNNPHIPQVRARLAVREESDEKRPVRLTLWDEEHRPIAQVPAE